jgi:hypothetical protein
MIYIEVLYRVQRKKTLPKKAAYIYLLLRFHKFFLFLETVQVDEKF